MSPACFLLACHSLNHSPLLTQTHTLPPPPPPPKKKENQQQTIQPTHTHTYIYIYTYTHTGPHLRGEDDAGRIPGRAHGPRLRAGQQPRAHGRGGVPGAVRGGPPDGEAVLCRWPPGAGVEGGTLVRGCGWVGGGLGWCSRQRRVDGGMQACRQRTRTYDRGRPPTNPTKYTHSPLCLPSPLKHPPTHHPRMQADPRRAEFGAARGAGGPEPAAGRQPRAPHPRDPGQGQCAFFGRGDNMLCVWQILSLFLGGVFCKQFCAGDVLYTHTHAPPSLPPNPPPPPQNTRKSSAPTRPSASSPHKTPRGAPTGAVSPSPAPSATASSR